MSNQTTVDAEAYDKEYDAFIKQLEDFHQQRGTHFKKLPRINGKGIDLYLLYVVVTARGGWQKVNSRSEWDEILEDFRLPSSCINASTALKHIYLRYLDAYERINFLGEDGDENSTNADEDESRPHRVRRNVRTLNLVPLAYNHSQHNVSETLRANSGMSTEMYKSSLYDRLALSLSCPLPNEHDFAFNMCTLLSNEGKHTLQLAHCTRLIEFMLAHTGVFRDRETQKYFISNYKVAKGKSLVQFWIDSVEDKSVLDLLSPDCYDASMDSSLEKAINHEKTLRSNLLYIKPLSLLGSKESPPLKDVEKSQYADSRNDDQRGEGGCPPKLGVFSTLSCPPKRRDSLSAKLEHMFKALCNEGADLKLEPDDAEIFHLGRDLGLLDSEGTRISQVLHILRNLSFEEINVTALAQSTTCLRFLVLCVCSRWGGLAVGALDTLGNIAAEVALKDPAVDPTSALLLTTICQGVSSQDRALVLRSLEVLNKLAVNDPNEEVLSYNIEQCVYDQICRFLTIHDIMLLIYTLESLYSLSSLGMEACNAIVRAKGSVQTLISLLTVEAQSYGPEACIGMKVVETVTGVVSETESASAAAPAQAASVITTTVSVAAPSVVAPTQTAITTVTPATVTAVSSAPVVQTPVKVAPKPPTFTPEVKKVIPRIVPPEVEDFVINWVSRNYEGCPNNAIEQAIVYRHFAASMHSLGRKQGLNPVLLSNCVRKVFGSNVGPTRRPVEDGTEKWHYNGIKRRDGIVVPAVPDKKVAAHSNSCTPQLTPTPIISASTLSSLNSTINTPLSTPKLDKIQPVAPQGSILKAHLSAPLRNSLSPVKVSSQGVMGGSVPPSAHTPPYSKLSSPGPPNSAPRMPIPRSDNSSLIKSLLATKVNTSGSGSLLTYPTEQPQPSQSAPPAVVIPRQTQHQHQRQHHQLQTKPSQIQSKVPPGGVPIPSYSVSCSSSGGPLPPISNIASYSKVPLSRQIGSLISNSQASSQFGGGRMSPPVNACTVGQYTQQPQQSNQVKLFHQNLPPNSQHQQLSQQPMTPSRQEMEQQQPIQKPLLNSPQPLPHKLPVQIQQPRQLIQQLNENTPQSIIRPKQQQLQQPHQHLLRPEQQHVHQQVPLYQQKPQHPQQTQEHVQNLLQQTPQQKRDILYNQQLTQQQQQLPLSPHQRQHIQESQVQHLPMPQQSHLHAQLVQHKGNPPEEAQQQQHRQMAAVPQHPQHSKLHPPQKQSQQQLFQQPPQGGQHPVALPPQRVAAVQVSRNIQKQNGPTENSDAQTSKATAINGIKEEPSDSKIVTSFEGILQNGLKEEIDEKDIKSEKDGAVETQIEKRNLLADLLERTVGGDVLNGVVDKDIRITERGIQIVGHSVVNKMNGPITSNGQLEVSHGVKRPATPETSGSVKRLAVEDPRTGSDSRITLYVSQNGNDGEVISQGHQVILNQGQVQQIVPTQAQIVNTQTVVTPQGSMIIQRPASQANVIVQQPTSHHIISQPTRAVHSTQSTTVSSSSTAATVVHHSGQTQGVISSGAQVITQNPPPSQVIHQVITHGQSGQKVILHGGQLGQVLGGQVLLPHNSNQSIVVQGGGNIPGQVIMQGISPGSQNPVIVQGPTGHSQVLVHSSSNQGPVLLQSNNNQPHLVVSGVSQGQSIVSSNSHNPVVVNNSGGQAMIVTGSHGQQMVVNSSQSQGQVLVQGNHVGNTVFLTPQQASQAGQKTLIILPNPKVMVAGNQSSGGGQVVLQRQVVQQIVSSSNNSSPVISSPIRTVRSVSNLTEYTSSAYSSNPTTASGPSNPPVGPAATPVTHIVTSTTPHIPAPQVLSSGVARRSGKQALQFICEWRGCNLVFSSPNQVYHHACKVHCPPHITELTCLWTGCDAMVRKRFSTMTHIHDRHCNEQLMQIVALRRQQISANGKTEIPMPQTPPPHPGYAPNAAFHAIKRHALEVINQRDAVEKEGPVTKSIRLTAALILRNLVIYSNMGKNLLKGYEADLSNVAISSMESSRTVSQILYDIHLPDHQAL